MERLCKEILAYLPEDFFANFYLATCSKNKTALGSFLYTVDIDEHYDDIPDILDYILKGLKSDWTMATGNFIERAYKSNDLKLYHKYRTKFEIENAKIEECVYEPAFPRDVFVAYSSADMLKVEQLVSVLEEELNCFVAARNLRHGSGAVENYEDAIHTAIEHCEVVVFVSSGNSRSIKCDAFKELDYIEKHCKDKPRVEYLIKDYSGRPSERFFRNFFSGLEYCTSEGDVAERVSSIIMGGTYKAEEKRVVPEIAKSHATIPQPTAKNEVKESENVAENFTEETFNGWIVCRNCKKLNIPAAKFCPDCGSNKFFYSFADYAASKIKFCAQCGTCNGVNDKYCIECGSTKFVPTKAEYDELVIKREENERLRKLREEEDRLRREEEERIRREEEERLRLFGKNENFELRKDSHSLIRYVGKGGDVVIPDIVTCIENKAFYYCKNVLSVKIPSGVKYIDYNAFYKCASLKKIDIPDSVSAIGYGAFTGCASLTDIKIPYIAKIDCNMFEECSSVTEIDVPDGVKSIEDSAFRGCKSLTRIKIPKSVESIGVSVFENCTSLAKIELPAGIREISNSAFRNCVSLTEAALSGKVTAIGSLAFSGCKALESITIPESVETIGYHAFSDCPDLKTIYCHVKKPAFGFPKGWDRDWIDDKSGVEIIWKPKNKN